MRRKSETTKSKMIDQKEKTKAKENITSLQTGKTIYPGSKSQDMNTNIDELMKEFIKLMINISENSRISLNSRTEAIKAKQLSNKIIKYVNNQQACIREELYKNITTSKIELQNKIFKIIQLTQIIIKNCRQVIQECNSQNFHIFITVLKQIHTCMILFFKNYQDLVLLPCFKKQIFTLWNQCLFEILSDFYFWMIQQQNQGQEFYCMCFYNCLLIGKMALQTNNYAYTYQMLTQYPLDPIPQLLQLVINKLPSMSTLKSRKSQRSSSKISQQKSLILDFFIQCIELQITRYCIKRNKINSTEYWSQDPGQDLQSIMKLCHIYVNFIPGTIFSFYLINLLQIVSSEIELLIYLDDLTWSTANQKDVLLMNEDQFHYLTIILCKYSGIIPKKQCTLQRNTRKWLSIFWNKIVANPHQSIKLLESTKTYMSQACSQQILQILFQQYEADSKLDSAYHSIFDNKYIKNIISYIMSLDNSQEFIYTTIVRIKQFIVILFNVLIYPHDFSYEKQQLFVFDPIQGSSSELVLRHVSSLYLFISDQLNRTNFSYKNSAKLTYRKYLSISLLEQFHQQLNKISKKNSILQLYNKSLLQIFNNIDSIECQNARDELLGYIIKLTIISHRQTLQIKQQNKNSMQQQNVNENIDITKIKNKVSIFSNILTKKIQNLQIIQQCCQYLIEWCIKTNRIQVEDQQMQALLQFIYVSLTKYPYSQNQKLDICYGYNLATYILITVYTMGNPPVHQSLLLSIIHCNQIRYLMEIISAITYPRQIIYEIKDNILQFFIYTLAHQERMNKDVTNSSEYQHINKIIQISEQVYNKLLQAITFYHFEQQILVKNKKTNRRYNQMRDNVKKQRYDINVKILYTELQYMSIEVDMIMVVMFCYYLLQKMLNIVPYIRNVNRQGDKIAYGKLITMIYVIKKALYSRNIINNKSDNKQVKQFLHSNIIVKILNQLNQVILSNIQSKLSASNFLNIISLYEPNFYQRIKNLQQVRELFSQAQNAIRQYSLQYGINLIQQNQFKINQSKAGRFFKLIKVKDTV